MGWGERRLPSCVVCTGSGNLPCMPIDLPTPSDPPTRPGLIPGTLEGDPRTIDANTGLPIGEIHDADGNRPADREPDEPQQPVIVTGQTGDAERLEAGDDATIHDIVQDELIGEKPAGEHAGLLDPNHVDDLADPDDAAKTKTELATEKETDHGDGTILVGADEDAAAHEQIEGDETDDGDADPLEVAESTGEPSDTDSGLVSEELPNTDD